MSQQEVVEGGGLKFWTADPFLKAAVRRCAQLERELEQARYHEVARYRTLRRDVSQIKRAVLNPQK
jgi:hypothetical protein